MDKYITGRGVGKGNPRAEPIGIAADRVWMEEAACLDHELPPETWDTPDDETVPHSKAAAKVCKTECLFRAECLEYALDNGMEYGIWGGLDPRNRTQSGFRILARLRRGMEF